MQGWGPGGTRGCRDGDPRAPAAALHPPDPNLCGSAAALGGPAPCLLPACRASGWPGSRGQGMLEWSRAARPRGQRGSVRGWHVSAAQSLTLRRGGVSQDGCRIPPGLGGAGRAPALLEKLVQLWKVSNSAAGDEAGGVLPGAGSVPTAGSGASGTDGGRDPVPGLWPQAPHPGPDHPQATRHRGWHISSVAQRGLAAPMP